MSYRDDLQAKLESAQKRVRQGREVKALKSSAPTLFEIIDLEISLIANIMTADKALAYDEYLEKHGEIRGIMRIRNLLDSREVEAESAAQEVASIQSAVKDFDDAAKQL